MITSITMVTINITIITIITSRDDVRRAGALRAVPPKLPAQVGLDVPGAHGAAGRHEGRQGPIQY